VDNKKIDGFIEPFFMNENFCKHDCALCSYCDKFAQRCIDTGEADKTIRLADSFYRDYDMYTQMLGRVKYTDDDILNEGIDIDFDA
jgi:histone acetyltransferase (RNA polymerase elongator complex component)